MIKIFGEALQPPSYESSIVFLSTWCFLSPGLLLIMQVFVGILCGSMWNGWAVAFGCQQNCFENFDKLHPIFKKGPSCQTGVFFWGFPRVVLCRRYAFEAVNTDFEDFLQASTETSVSADLSVQSPTRCFGFVMRKRVISLSQFKDGFFPPPNTRGLIFGTLGPIPFITRSPNLAPADTWVDLPSELRTTEKISGSMMQYDKHGLYRQAIKGAF